MGEVTEASRSIEFSNPKQHVGWQKGRPVFVVFSLDMARDLFEEDYASGRVTAICVAPPHSIIAQTLEQCVSFFSGGSARAFVEASIFAVDA